MIEIYKNIKDYEGLYKISNLGNVKSVERTVLCKDGQNKFIYERIISPGNNGTGYLFVYLWKNNKSKRFYIHQLVAKHFIENPNNYNKVNHKDFNKKNNTVENLEWCTDSQNMAHCKGNKVYVIDEDEKTILNTFNSLTEAGLYFDKDKNTIKYYCRKNKSYYSKRYNKKVYFSFKPYIDKTLDKYKFKIKIKTT